MFHIVGMQTSVTIIILQKATQLNVLLLIQEH